MDNDNYVSKINKKPRPSTPELLHIQSDVGEQLGEGAYSYVKRVTGVSKEKLVVKIPGMESTNQSHRFEYCFKKAAHDYLKEKHGYDEPPIVLPHNITESSSLFASESLPNPVVFTMDEMESDLKHMFDGKANHENPQETALSLGRTIDGVIDILNENGFLIKDMHMANIFVKDSKAYLGDCGECLIQKGTEAEVYFNKAVKEAGFPKHMLSSFVVKEGEHNMGFSL